MGGGPAGAALALRLAQFGRRVAVAEKAPFPRQHIGEALSAGVIPLLDVLGLRGALCVTGALPSGWATVEWAGERRRYQVQGGPGFLVDRARFDAHLLEAACAMPGVRLYQPVRVVEATRVGGRWEVALQTGGTIRATYLAEASGRTPIRISSQDGRPPPRKRLSGIPTLALYAYWRDAGDFGEGEIVVEGGREAWYWGAPLPGGKVNATVFVDRGASVDYERLIRESKLLGPRLRRARRVSAPRICDATSFVHEQPVTATSIRLGDAALSIDPISSQGVQTALGMGLHAAVVLNTMLDRPEDRGLAMDFYRARLFASASFHASAAGDFYRRQADWDGGDFWRKRAPVLEPPARRGQIAPGSHIALSPALQFGLVAVATASHVVRRDGVQAHGKEYAFVGREIAVSPLLRELDGRMTALDVVRRWSRRLPATQALEVLQWAWEEGLVVEHR